jgi:uncharacterized protein
MFHGILAKITHVACIVGLNANGVLLQAPGQIPRLPSQHIGSWNSGVRRRGEGNCSKETSALILVDTGSLVTLFDPADGSHKRCVGQPKILKEPICAIPPVLTEAFYLLSPGSTGCLRLVQFIAQKDLIVWFLDDRTFDRAFDLKVTYADRPMDFADASLVAAAETLRLRKVFTLDRGGFDVSQMKRGRRYYPFQVI